MTTSPKTDLKYLLAYHCKEAGLPAPVFESRFYPKRRWKSDCAWPKYKILAECHGGTFSHGGHVRGVQYRSDREKANTAQLLGFKYFEFTTEQIEDGYAVETLRRAFIIAKLEQEKQDNER